ncbi:hypothetical protein A2625_06960 [candidate division WOR-1 bacterium RIFCSPHIGHO2_01_FULL_53_15]|uniref:Response regulatory domain-containing protein n=1 Tax=candidate division WOR-1 bacterium RIFCSPHIGHO2_01_FULL_53_15 TaxID=1802564 RepID=A0A1F4Q4K2_UNCSA|nr:MAG: hypothetical protein A2625_06960 [candidate division WOR-1 bacterium RIFCSPHIGHO2_01_FULL_53_15]
MAKVLIADDQESMRIIIAGMLRESGHEVETVEDGRAAFDKLNAGSYDLVVADVNMPKLNGLEFLAKVRETKPQQKVVFVTGLLEETVKLGSEKLGLNGLILKPFDKTAALEKITRILAQ